MRPLPSSGCSADVPADPPPAVTAVATGRWLTVVRRLIGRSRSLGRRVQTYPELSRTREVGVAGV